ncbi:hypothetical protein HY857_01675 [Candidatus Saccharibacteria bacterium]|nr:hypothetical protein [Candidatus Saccharibacteria bacterium]
MDRRQREELRIASTAVVDTLRSKREQGVPELSRSDLLLEVRRTIESKLGRTAFLPIGQATHALWDLEAEGRIASRHQRHPGPYDNSPAGTFYHLINSEESPSVLPKGDFRQYLPR